MLSGARSVLDRGRNKSSAAQMARNDHDFRPSAAIRPRGFGAHRGHRGLRKRLHALKDQAGCLPAEGRDYAYAAPRVGPDLKIWAVPQDGEALLSRVGSSLPRNSQNRPRPGLKGISTHGKRQLQWSCRLMEDFRRRLAMWTVSLPDEDYPDLARLGTWPVFQRRLIDLHNRELKAQGDEAIVVATVELGPKRFNRTGVPMPHVHVITTGWGRHHSSGGWLLSPHRMDALVEQAARYAGLPKRDRRSASRIEPVKFSVASYMSKYLTKELPVSLNQIPEEWHSLIPRQWWNQSEACKALVDGCIFKLPPAFAAFVLRNCSLLEGLGLGRGGTVVVGQVKKALYEMPLEMFRFRFRSPEAMMQGIELFALWVAGGEHLDAAGLVLSGVGPPEGVTMPATPAPGGSPCVPDRAVNRFNRAHG